jgi:ureidoacrylate peracid hydrolase
VTTNCCVETTVRDASQRDFHTFVVADAVAEYEQDRNDVALKSMGMLFAKVVNTSDVAKAWQA